MKKCTFSDIDCKNNFRCTIYIQDFDLGRVERTVSKMQRKKYVKPEGLRILRHEVQCFIPKKMIGFGAEQQHTQMPASQNMPYYFQTMECMHCRNNNGK
ncbi:MAG: hypothetical protein FWF34_02575 [Alphaproteobacteria bacterium]|nr:hypothetical protein [Alphaproteobacteria bacterium]MCL2890116.1 hypothetical protein [Alphaproteobacteria bacterium]